MYVIVSVCVFLNIKVMMVQISTFFQLSPKKTRVLFGLATVEYGQMLR